jgi:hypothetical protein
MLMYMDVCGRWMVRRRLVEGCCGVGPVLTYATYANVCGHMQEVQVFGGVGLWGRTLGEDERLLQQDVLTELLVYIYI